MENYFGKLGTPTAGVRSTRLAETILGVSPLQALPPFKLISSLKCKSNTTNPYQSSFPDSHQWQSQTQGLGSTSLRHNTIIMYNYSML